MKVFDEAFLKVIGNEGGYVNDSLDRGGETKYGISKKSYPNVDIKSLSLEEAKNLYYVGYWNTKRGNLSFLPDAVAIELFDTSVNMGSDTARRMLQKSLNLLNRVETRYDDLKVDGWLGSTTFKAVALVNEDELLKVLNGLQFNRYLEIVENNHSQERFFAGWIKRT